MEITVKKILKMANYYENLGPYHQILSILLYKYKNQITNEQIGSILQSACSGLDFDKGGNNINYVVENLLILQIIIQEVG